MTKMSLSYETNIFLSLRNHSGMRSACVQGVTYVSPGVNVTGFPSPLSLIRAS